MGFNAAFKGLIRQGLLATSRANALPDGSFQDRHFQRAYDLALVEVFFVFIEFFSKVFLWTKKSKAENLPCCPQAEAKGS